MGVKIRDALNLIRTMPYTHSSATVKDTVYLLNGRAMLALESKDANVENVFLVSGLIEYDKATGEAWTTGDSLFWDNTAGKFTKTAIGNTPAGIALEDAESADTTGFILLLITEQRLLLGAKLHDGDLFGSGKSSDPYTYAGNAKMASFYTKTTGTGSVEGLYWRHYLGGAGSSGEAARFFATVNGVAAANARGAHISLGFSAYDTSYITGEGRAIKGTLHIPSGGAMPAGGTYSAIQAEVYCDGNDSDPSAVTELSIMDFTVQGGNATAQGKVKNLMSLHVPTGEEAAGNMHVSTITAATMNAACTEALRLVVNGNVRWIPLATAIT